MSENTKKGTWAAIGAALIGVLAAKPELVLRVVTDHVGLIASVLFAGAVSIIVTDQLKTTKAIDSIQRTARLLCILVYVGLRCAFAYKAGMEYGLADLFIDAVAGTVLAWVTPHLYDLLPASFRKKRSRVEQLKRSEARRKAKIVETPTGDKLRELDHPSADDERTRCTVELDLDVGEPTDPRHRRDQDGHAEFDFLMWLAAASILLLLSMLAAGFGFLYSWLWTAAIVLFLAAIVCIAIAVGL